MKYILVFIFFLLNFSTFSQNIKIPKGYKELKRVEGDLNKDGNKELVIAYDTGVEGDFGTEREICVYKKSGDKWNLWHKVSGIILPSQHGGIMGDPFMDIYIKNGCIVVQNSGGSADKWDYVHTYRYQNNNWYLIGATINYYRYPSFFEEYDYNVSTGKINVSIKKIKSEDYWNNLEEEEYEYLEENYTYKVQPAKKILMNGFYPGNNFQQLKNEDSFYY